jgi:hypothetical protein
MDEKTKSTMNTVYGVLAIPVIAVLMYGAYFVFTYKPTPKPPAPKIETFIADGKQKETGPEIKIKGAVVKSDGPKVWDVKLVWEVSNADEVTIDQGIGKVEAKGERQVEIDKSTTFVMKAKNITGDVTYSLDVDVPAPEK